MAPYIMRELKHGEFASSVLAISWGKGDPHNLKDPITLVFVDDSSAAAPAEHGRSNPSDQGQSHERAYQDLHSLRRA